MVSLNLLHKRRLQLPQLDSWFTEIMKFSILITLTALVAVGYAASLPSWMGGSSQANQQSSMPTGQEDPNMDNAIENYMKNCFNAQEMALRAVRTALKSQLAPYNTMSAGMIFKLIDAIIPLPPSPLDNMEPSGNNPFGMFGTAAGWIAPGAMGALNNYTNQASGVMAGAINGAASSVSNAAQSAWSSVGNALG